MGRAADAVNWCTGTLAKDTRVEDYSRLIRLKSPFSSFAKFHLRSSGVLVFIVLMWLLATGMRVRYLTARVTYACTNSKRVSHGFHRKKLKSKNSDGIRPVTPIPRRYKLKIKLKYDAQIHWTKSMLKTYPTVGEQKRSELRPSNHFLDYIWKPKTKPKWLILFMELFLIKKFPTHTGRLGFTSFLTNCKRLKINSCTA